jgi:hypothetical protein
VTVTVRVTTGDGVPTLAAETPVSGAAAPHEVHTIANAATAIRTAHNRETTINMSLSHFAQASSMLKVFPEPLG